MNLYSVFNYLANIVAPFMVATDECLYNALVRTLSPRPQLLKNGAHTTPLTVDALIDIRESARELIAFIDQEIQARADEDEEAAAASVERNADQTA